MALPALLVDSFPNTDDRAARVNLVHQTPISGYKTVAVLSLFFLASLLPFFLLLHSYLQGLITRL